MKRVKHEVLRLILAVIMVDAVFLGGYFLSGIRTASDLFKAMFTAIWTLATLALVIRSLSRIRNARLERRGGEEVRRALR